MQLFKSGTFGVVSFGVRRDPAITMPSRVLDRFTSRKLLEEGVTPAKDQVVYSLVHGTAPLGFVNIKKHPPCDDLHVL